MKRNTQKNFILQLGSLIALYISVTTLLILIFGITNLRFLDEAASYWENESSREAVRNSIAMLIVFFPAYLVFTRLSNQDRRKYSQGEYSTFAKWLVYISLLGGILILLGDLVTLIMYFLNGEITTRFLVKVFALLAIVGGALHYYILDVRGYFKNRTDKAMYFGMGAIVVVIASLLFGYSYIETPSEVREMRLDEQQVTDLRDTYWRIDEYYRQQETLPETTDVLYTQTRMPEAPEGRDSYTYSVIDDTTFELCATFAAQSSAEYQDFPEASLVIEEKILYDNHNWEHGEGKVCFTRKVQEIAE